MPCKKSLLRGHGKQQQQFCGERTLQGIVKELKEEAAVERGRERLLIAVWSAGEDDDDDVSTTPSPGQAQATAGELNIGTGPAAEMKHAADIPVAVLLVKKESPPLAPASTECDVKGKAATRFEGKPTSPRQSIYLMRTHS